MHSAGRYGLDLPRQRLEEIGRQRGRRTVVEVHGVDVEAQRIGKGAHGEAGPKRSERGEVDRQTVFDQDSEAWRRNMPPITRHGLRITRTKCLHDRRARKLVRTQRKLNGMFQALSHLQPGRTYSPAALMRSVVINRPLNIKFP